MYCMANNYILIREAMEMLALINCTKPSTRCPSANTARSTRAINCYDVSSSHFYIVIHKSRKRLQTPNPHGQTKVTPASYLQDDEGIVVPACESSTDSEEPEVPPRLAPAEPREPSEGGQYTWNGKGLVIHYATFQPNITY